MTIIYRMCGIASSNPSPIYQEDKFALNKLCLDSFVRAFTDIKPKVIFILDKCGTEYYSMIDIPFEYEVKPTFFGINGTMLESYRLACELDDIVIFQECDYFYRGVIGKLYESAIKELKLVSPYDHRNFYLDHHIHSRTCDIHLVDNHHFRTTERNTMTWGCHSDLVKENIDILNKYGYLDADVWHELRAKGYPLWVPIPSFATHMVEDYLSPGVDWKELWKTQTS